MKTEVSASAFMMPTILTETTSKRKARRLFSFPFTFSARVASRGNLVGGRRGREALRER